MMAPLAARISVLRDAKEQTPPTAGSRLSPGYSAQVPEGHDRSDRRPLEHWCVYGILSGLCTIWDISASICRNSSRWRPIAMWRSTSPAFAHLTANGASASPPTERLKAERNRASEEIARRKRAGENADDLLAQMKRVSEEIKRDDERIAELDARLQQFMLSVPNLPHSSVPVGRRFRQRRGSPLGSAAEIRFCAAAALGSRRAGRNPRSRTRRENCRRAFCRLSRTGRATGARDWRIFSWMCTRRTATRNICRHFW